MEADHPIKIKDITDEEETNWTLTLNLWYMQIVGTVELGTILSGNCTYKYMLRLQLCTYKQTIYVQGGPFSMEINKYLTLTMWS